MIRVVQNPPKSEWPAWAQRPSLELEFLESSVQNILTRVRQSGDRALFTFTEQFDGVKVNHLEVTQEEQQRAAGRLAPALKKAIEVAAANIEKFHAAQQREPLAVETMPGVMCWRRPVPIEKVGIYIPGGSAPLFSTVLMLAIPARIAGCGQVVLCSPPDATGELHPAIVYAAALTGVHQIFKVGGAQAIAALAYGTETIPAVFKIFGPGNQYVTKAKQIVSQQGVAIDMPAGPSEVLVIADAEANPAYVAADLLSQAEHGRDSQVMLVTTSSELVPQVEAELDRQIKNLPRREVALAALQNSVALVMNSREDVIAFTNVYAPEHLIINTVDCDEIATFITTAGSIFLGALTPESAGDYASGTNHTLPTNGFARAYSGVSLESFQRFMTLQKMTAEGLATLGPVVATLAEAEQLEGHKASITIRLAKKDG